MERTILLPTNQTIGTTDDVQHPMLMIPHKKEIE